MTQSGVLPSINQIESISKYPNPSNLRCVHNLERETRDRSAGPRKLCDYSWSCLGMHLQYVVKIASRSSLGLSGFNSFGYSVSAMIRSKNVSTTGLRCCCRSPRGWRRFRRLPAILGLQGSCHEVTCSKFQSSNCLRHTHKVPENILWTSGRNNLSRGVETRVKSGGGGPLGVCRETREIRRHPCQWI